MQLDLVTKETAILAKEKGFDEKCLDWFAKGDKDSINLGIRTYNTNKGNRSDFICVQPSQSLLQKWLRDIHRIYVQPQKTFHNTTYSVGKIPTNSLNHNIGPGSFLTGKGHKLKWTTYEQALEKGLQIALQSIKT